MRLCAGKHGVLAYERGHFLGASVIRLGQVREKAMPEIVQQRRKAQKPDVARRYLAPVLVGCGGWRKRIGAFILIYAGYHFGGHRQHAERMLKARMVRRWVCGHCKSQLIYAAHALEKRRIYYLQLPRAEHDRSPHAVMYHLTAAEMLWLVPCHQRRNERVGAGEKIRVYSVFIDIFGHFSASSFPLGRFL